MSQKDTVDLHEKATQLLNHLEEVLDEENLSRIDHGLWNEVSMFLANRGISVPDRKTEIAITVTPEITDPNAPGYRPPCCDRGAGGDSSPCCDFGGCAADMELEEMAAKSAPPRTSTYDHLMAAAKGCDERGLPLNADGLRSLARSLFSDRSK